MSAEPAAAPLTVEELRAAKDQLERVGLLCGAADGLMQAGH